MLDHRGKRSLRSGKADCATIGEGAPTSGAAHRRQGDSRVIEWRESSVERRSGLAVRAPVDDAVLSGRAEEAAADEGSASAARATASAVDVDPGVWAGGAGGGSRGAHPVGPEDAMGEIDHRGNVDLGDQTFGENASEETQFAAILVADAGQQVLVQ